MSDFSTRARDRARRRLARLLPMRLAGVVLSVAVLVAGFSFVVLGRRFAADSDRRSAAAIGRAASQLATDPGDAASSAVATYAVASPAAPAEVESTSTTRGAAGQKATGLEDPLTTAAPVAVESSAASSAAKPSAATGAPKTAPQTAKPPAAAPTARSLDAYRGLGSWVDIYDDSAWNDPTAAIRDMARHGVRTLFIETSNSTRSYALKDPPTLRAFIREAHARSILVVAWYLPDVGSGARDYDRIAQAIRFRTPDGQMFDGFALDIESSSIRSQAERNRALEALSLRIRALVGESYPLGAIIPSPTGLARPGSYWGEFPYTMLARTYDVFVPMSYYTYHGSGASAAYADTLSNVRILRAQKGCSQTPIHLIGGISEDSSAAEVKAFVRAVRETRGIGASLYGWPGTSDAAWQQLKAVGG